MAHFKIDMHVHTKNVSSCGKVDAVTLVNSYHKIGYDAIVITDHYYDGYFRRLKNLSWEAKIAKFASGFRAALQTGRLIGLKVFFGMELRFTNSDNDYLVYGCDELFLVNHPYLFAMELRQFRKLIATENILIYQAHPFRQGMTTADPALLDGVEVYNGNPRHDSANPRALEFAMANRLKMISGSDFHQPEDLGRGGIVIAKDVKTIGELNKVIQSNASLQIMGLSHP